MMVPLALTISLGILLSVPDVFSTSSASVGSQLMSKHKNFGKNFFRLWTMYSCWNNQERVGFIGIVISCLAWYLVSILLSESLKLVLSSSLTESNVQMLPVHPLCFHHSGNVLQPLYMVILLPPPPDPNPHHIFNRFLDWNWTYLMVEKYSPAQNTNI